MIHAARLRPRRKITGRDNGAGEQWSDAGYLHQSAVEPGLPRTRHGPAVAASRERKGLETAIEVGSFSI